MELLGKLVNHCKAGHIRLDSKLLYMHASRRSLGITVVNIFFLVRRYMICGISGELPKHIHEGKSINERGVSVVVQLALSERSWDH